MADSVKYEGRWLSFHEASFTNLQGDSRTWEYATRSRSEGAAGVVAILNEENPQLILVKQFRPPLKKYSLEFPAGLVDPGESVESAALRELQEETGFIGEVINTGPPMYSSPGMTDEYVSLVTVKITGQTDSKLDADENIEIIKLPLANLADELEKIHRTGVAVDAKLWSFAQGLGWDAKQVQ